MSVFSRTVGHIIGIIPAWPLMLREKGGDGHNLVMMPSVSPRSYTNAFEGSDRSGTDVKAVQHEQNREFTAIASPSSFLPMGIRLMNPVACGRIALCTNYG